MLVIVSKRIIDVHSDLKFVNIDKFIKNHDNLWWIDHQESKCKIL